MEEFQPFSPRYGMVLAAGLGTRMRAVSADLPKPLVNVGGQALLDHAIDFLQTGGVEKIVVNISYKAEQVEAHLRQHYPPSAIQLSPEETPLETGGGIAKALPWLGDAPFVVINSDNICINGLKHAVQSMASAWDDASMDALLLMQPRASAMGYDGAGDFFLHEGGILQRRGDASSAPYVFAGVQLLHPRFFAHAPEGAFSMNLLYNQGKDAKGMLRRVKGLVHDGDWLHVGDPAGYNAAEQYFHQRTGA